MYNNNSTNNKKDRWDRGKPARQQTLLWDIQIEVVIKYWPIMYTIQVFYHLKSE